MTTFTWNKAQDGSTADWTTPGNWDQDSGYPGDTASRNDIAIIPKDTEKCNVNSAVTVEHLFISGNNSSAFDIRLQAALTISGNLHIQAGRFDLLGENLTVSGTTGISGTLNPAYSTCYFGWGNTDSANWDLSVRANGNLNGGGGNWYIGNFGSYTNATVTLTSGNLYVSGNQSGYLWSPDQGGVTWNPNNGTVYMCKSGKSGAVNSYIRNAQASPSYSADSYPFYNLVISGQTEGASHMGGTASNIGIYAGRGIRVDNNLYVASGTFKTNSSDLWVSGATFVDSNLYTQYSECKFGSGTAAFTNDVDGTSKYGTAEGYGLYGGNQNNGFIDLGGGTHAVGNIKWGSRNQLAGPSFKWGSGTVTLNRRHASSYAIAQANGAWGTNHDMWDATDGGTVIINTANSLTGTDYVAIHSYSPNPATARNGVVFPNLWISGMVSGTQVRMTNTSNANQVVVVNDLIVASGCQLCYGGNFAGNNDIQGKFRVSGLATVKNGGKMDLYKSYDQDFWPYCDTSFGAIDLKSGSYFSMVSGNTILSGNVGVTSEGYSWAPYYQSTGTTLVHNSGTFVNKSQKGYIGYRQHGSAQGPFWNYTLDLQPAGARTQNSGITIQHNWLITSSTQSSNRNGGVIGLRNESAYTTQISGMTTIAPGCGYGAPIVSYHNRIFFRGGLTVNSGATLGLPEADTGTMNAYGTVRIDKDAFVEGGRI
jgi:hypothetical protein